MRRSRDSTAHRARPSQRQHRRTREGHPFVSAIEFGIAFELPLILAILSVASLVDAPRLRSWWRIAVSVIFVFAAIATPTGDPLTMTTLAAPMVLLYFGSVGFAMIIDRRRARTNFPDNWSDDEASPLDTRTEPVDGASPIDPDA